MAQFNFKLPEEQLEALRSYAARRRSPVSWLVRDYISYLLSGGEPLAAPDEGLPSGADLTALLQSGGAFDWLAAEPDLYSLEDG